MHPPTQHVAKDVVKDEPFHVEFGLLLKRCIVTTKEIQQERKGGEPGNGGGKIMAINHVRTLHCTVVSSRFHLPTTVALDPSHSPCRGKCRARFLAQSQSISHVVRCCRYTSSRCTILSPAPRTACPPTLCCSLVAVLSARTLASSFSVHPCCSRCLTFFALPSAKLRLLPAVTHAQIRRNVGGLTKSEAKIPTSSVLPQILSFQKRHDC